MAHLPSKVMHGARGKVYITNPNNGKTVLVGVFANCAWGLTYDVQPVNILGRFGPAELVYTAQEPVSLTCSGFRVVGAGVHVLAGMPNVKDLLFHEYLTIVINDRATPGPAGDIAKFHSVRPVSYQTTLSARNLEDITVSYIGLLVDDEDTQLAESAGAHAATDLP